jgi:hypothetical protein
VITVACAYRNAGIRQASHTAGFDGIALMASRVWQAALLVVTTGLCGCASTAQIGAPQADADHVGHAHLVADRWPTWAGGEPSGAPARPPNTPYPNVFENPPARSLETLSAEDQSHAAADLDTLRGRVSNQIKAAAAFDDKNTAAALSEVTRGKLAADISAAPN